MTKFYRAKGYYGCIIESVSPSHERSIYVATVHRPTTYLAWTNPVLDHLPPLEDNEYYTELTEEEVFLLLL